MAYLKRTFYFLIVNFLILTTVGFVVRLVCNYFQIDLGNNGYALVLYSVFGMGSAIVSLFLSKTMVKRKMKVQIIDPNSATGQELELVQMVHRMASEAGIKKMPEFGIYNAPEVNAFATGPSKNNSLVAVSTGLLNRMNRDQVEGVIGHEVAHVANGDMVTMTLIQGMLNTMVLFVASILANIVSNALSNDDNGPGYFMHTMIYMAVQVVLGIFASVAVGFFSRHREYKADIGGARFAGRHKMISALEALANPQAESQLDANSPIAAFKISGKTRGSLARLLSTHPPIEDRIQALKDYRDESHQR